MEWNSMWVCGFINTAANESFSITSYEHATLSAGAPLISLKHLFGIPFGITRNSVWRENMKNERFHTSRTHRRTCIQKSFFYFVHEANAFVVLRFFPSKDDFSILFLWALFWYFKRFPTADERVERSAREISLEVIRCLTGRKLQNSYLVHLAQRLL